jgi:hypothetical protein
LSIAELERKHLRCFFHEEKESLWETVRTVHYHPEKLEALGMSPQCGFIAEGGPGSGKSRFGLLIMLLTQTHGLFVNVLTLKSRINIYKAIKQPCIPGSLTTLEPRQVSKE